MYERSYCVPHLDKNLDFTGGITELSRPGFSKTLVLV